MNCCSILHLWLYDTLFPISLEITLPNSHLTPPPPPTPPPPTPPPPHPGWFLSAQDTVHVYNSCKCHMTTCAITSSLQMWDHSRQSCCMFQDLSGKLKVPIDQGWKCFYEASVCSVDSYNVYTCFLHSPQCYAHQSCVHTYRSLAHTYTYTNHTSYSVS